MSMRCVRLALLAVLLPVAAARAGVLPDDRADILYHRYQGGGLTVQFGCVLFR